MNSRIVRIFGLGAVLAAAVWAQGYERGDRPAVPSMGRGEIRPHSWIREQKNGAPALNTTPEYLFPSDITTAYGITPSMGGGSGVTIAIVDAYDAPNAAADLATFSTQFNLPACTTANGCFTKVSQTGSTTALPTSNSGWEVETSLDVQWVHAVAPNAHILLVEARSSSTNDLLTAVDYAKAHASIVSMSWGGNEDRSETSSDSTFVESGVTFLASSGDTGGQVIWPASSPNVIAVGGTDLATTAGHIASPIVETAWNGSGGGCSSYEAKLAAQSGFVPSTCKNRAVPDVSMDGGTPVSVYISDQKGWNGVYGTSLAVQIYAAFIGTVNGGRVKPLSLALSDLYSAAAGEPASSLYISDFRDITSGSAGRFSSGPGWDFVTGLGSPHAGSLGPFLVNEKQ